MLLQKISAALENSKSKISDLKPAPPPPVEPPSTTATTTETKICKSCGSKNFWQSKKSDEWICFDCRPPKSEKMIGQTIGDCSLIAPEPPATSSDAVNDTIEDISLAGLESIASREWGPWIVRYPRPVCKCGESRVEENGTLFTIVKKCVRCREIVFVDDFVS